MTWTKVPAPDGRRCWVGAWNDEGCLVLEYEPEWCKPWAVTATGPGGAAIGTTPREALDGIGCDLPVPDVEGEPSAFAHRLAKGIADVLTATGSPHHADGPRLVSGPRPEAAPEPSRFAVGEWVRTQSGPVGLVTAVRPDGLLCVETSEGAQTWVSTVCEPTTRPDARWAIALDPKPGEVVADGRGREWRRTPAGEWSAARFDHITKKGGVWSDALDDEQYGGDADAPDVATLPDTLRGLDRLNAASDVLDGRLDALPDGVVVTPEWRQRCERDAIADRVGPGPDTVPSRYDAPDIPWDRVGPGWSVLCGTATDPEDACAVVEGFAPDGCVRVAASWMPWAPRSMVTAAFPPGADTNPRTSAGDAVDSEQDGRPVMAWWSGDIPDEDGTRCPYCYREPLTGEHFVLHESEPHPTAIAKVMGWRAVEVSDG